MILGSMLKKVGYMMFYIGKFYFGGWFYGKGFNRKVVGSDLNVDFF